MARSLLAFFASRFYDERKEHFNLPAEVFSTCRIVFFVKKRSCTIFICVEIKFNDLQVFIDHFLRLSTVF